MLPHMHKRASLTVVIGGSYLERIGRRERRYGTGVSAFCPAGMLHAQEFGQAGARQIIVEPQPDLLRDLTEFLNLEEAPYIASSELVLLGRRLLNELTKDDEFSSLAREGLALELLATFARASNARPPKPPIWLLTARDFMHANVCASLSIAQIASISGRHEVHLAREFRRHFRSSIGSYMRKLRTEEAARLLAHTREDITNIALQCGFANHAHLCRVFRAHCGTTPSQYREQHSV